MIRQAETKDIADITKLHYMAGRKMFQYYLASDEATSSALLRLLVSKPDTPFSRDFFWIYEEEETAKGVISLYPGGNMKSLERNIGRYGKEMMQIAGLWATIKMSARGSLNRYMPGINDNELYIQALAVYPDFRGQGIGSSLLGFASDNAKKNRFGNLALLVETTNKPAIKLYEKNGFQIVATREFKKKVQKHDLIGIHKMIADIAP